MSILADRNTKVLIQGVTSKMGLNLAENMIAMGTNLVGGVTPGKGGDWVLDGKVPIFDSLRAAIEATNAEATIIIVPPINATDAIYEAIDNAIPLIVCMTEGLPNHDIVRVKSLLVGTDTIFIGPNSPGVFSPGETMLGIAPQITAVKGNVGIISRSGTLGYEVMYELSKYGIGISTFIGLGADLIIGVDYSDLLPLFEEDPSTEKIILLEEFGGIYEEDIANFLSQHFTKPVIVMVAGKSTPAINSSINAGAISSAEKVRPQKNSISFQDVGVEIANTIEDIPDLIRKK